MEKCEKIPAWQLTKVRNKREVIEEARNKGRKVHFASLTDLSHLKNSELEPQYHKYKGRVALRGDIVNDDSGSYAVCTEQGSTASQMTAAIVMDIISRLPGCAGQSEDAVSAYTKVKMKDPPMFRMSRYLDTSTETQMAQIMGPVWKTQLFLLNEICTVSLWQDFCGNGNLRKFYWNTVWKNGNVFRYTGMFFRYTRKNSYLCMWTI